MVHKYGDKHTDETPILYSTPITVDTYAWREESEEKYSVSS